MQKWTVEITRTRTHFTPIERILRAADLGIDGLVIDGHDTVEEKLTFTISDGVVMNEEWRSKVRETAEAAAKKAGCEILDWRA